MCFPGGAPPMPRTSVLKFCLRPAQPPLRPATGAQKPRLSSRGPCACTIVLPYRLQSAARAGRMQRTLRLRPLPCGLGRCPSCFCPAHYTPVFVFAFCTGAGAGQALPPARRGPMFSDFYCSICTRIWHVYFPRRAAPVRTRQPAVHPFRPVLTACPLPCNQHTEAPAFQPGPLYLYILLYRIACKAPHGQAVCSALCACGLGPTGTAAALFAFAPHITRPFSGLPSAWGRCGGRHCPLH